MNLDPQSMPLPRPSTTGFHRRCRIAGLQLGHASLQRFSAAVRHLAPGNECPDADTIVSTGRALLSRFPGFHHAPPVQLRLRWLTAMNTMAREPHWTLRHSLGDRITVIQGYATSRDRLIPDQVPVIGGLDDALLVDLAWPALSAEIIDYLDFRRLRMQRAREIGVPPGEFRFTCEDWLRARHEEKAWHRHQRTHGLMHYNANVSSPRFQVI